MSYDGSGNYTVPLGTQGAPGQVIDSAKYNTFLTDLQTALSSVITRNGQSPATQNIPLGGFKIVGLAPGTISTDAVQVNQLYSLPKGSYTASQLPAFAAALVLDVSLSNVFEVAPLTGNVTGMTLQNPQAGQTVNLRFVQDATGGRTVVVPAGAQVAGGVDTGVNRVSWLLMTYSSRAARWEGSWSPTV